jgi:hypothetical protein
VPTFHTLPRFQRDFSKLSERDRRRFEKVVREQFVPDLALGIFRPGLRVKGVQSAPGVFEMTWAPNGRATWQYGDEIQSGERHVVWRRVGTHDIFNPGPP